MKSYRFINISHSFIAAAISLLSLLSLLTAGGCSDDFLPEPPAADGLVLSFYNSERTTRATDPSDGSLNETRLQSIAVALYADGAGDDAPAVKFARFSGFDAADGRWQTKMSISDSEAAALFGTVADGAACRLFAVANLSGDALTELEAMTKPTVNDLKAIAIDSEFGTRQVQELFVMSGDDRVRLSVDAAGAKSAVGSVELVRTAAKITLSLNIEKEITETNADGKKTVYSPLLPSEEHPSTIRVLLNNGVGKSVVVPSASHTPADEDYFSLTTGSEAYVFKNSTDTEYPFTQAIPFYTYPNSWSNTPEELHRTAMTLIIPWLRTTVKTDGSTDTSVTTRYYTVPVTPASMPQILSNNSYRIDLNVGMLGSEQPDKPEDITANYRVVSWATEDIDVDINDYRYLVVSPNTYTVDNSDRVSVQFYSSHPVDVADISLTFSRYSFVSKEGEREDRGKVVNFTISGDQIKKSNTESDKLCTYDIQYSPLSKLYTITINHPLKVWEPVDASDAVVSLTGYSNASASTVDGVKKRIVKYVPTDVDAYSPYRIDVTLRHTDKESYTESFTVFQNPAMYLDVDPNPGGDYPSGTTGSMEQHGYAFVNPTYVPERDFLFWTIPAHWENDDSLGGLLAFDNSQNNGNPNMYIINITQFNNSGTSSDDNYIIGDPRVLLRNNSLSGNLDTDPKSEETSAADWAVEAASLYKAPGQTGNRRLLWYYPTTEMQSKSMLVAPRFRIASSYGEMSAVTKENARRRCASYQEQGKPAGRWRMPTYGEFKFIVWLGETGKIPRLFDKNGTYWTAQGAYTIQNDGSLVKSSGSSAYVRAVYDDWYWDDETEYILHKNDSGGYDFTWGDMPKRNPQD